MKKTVLLLGGLGFIGQNLIAELKDHYNLVVFGRQAAKDDPDYRYCQGDFTNPAALETIFKTYPIDLVIHAISTSIPASHDIVLDIDSNLKSTIHLLDLLKQYHVSKIIFLSSGGTVYGSIAEPKAVTEDYPTYPISAHGINKLAIEKYLYLYQYLHQINYLILRLSNPFGEYHTSSQQGFINVTLKKIIQQEPITIWGDGEVVRDYIYVKDVAHIIHTLINQNVTNQIINIGSSQGYSLNALLAIIRQIAGDFAVTYTTARKFDVPNIVLDTTKLQATIPYQLTPLTDGIAHTYRWLKQTYA